MIEVPILRVREEDTLLRDAPDLFIKAALALYAAAGGEELSRNTVHIEFVLK